MDNQDLEILGPVLGCCVLLVISFVLYQVQQRRIRRWQGLADGTQCPECKSCDVVCDMDGLHCGECRRTFLPELLQQAAEGLAEHRAAIAERKRRDAERSIFSGSPGLFRGRTGWW